MNEYDVVVIGGGPTGLRAATLISKEKLNVLVIEKNREIGFPNHCSGLVSENFVAKYEEAKETLVNEIKGASMNATDVNLTFKDRKPHAFVIDREKFDKLLGKRAIESGVKILKGNQLKYAEETNEFVKLRLSNGGSLKSKIVIVASGANSGITRMFGFKNKTKETIRTIQAEAELEISDKEIVYVFTNKELFGNWFGWVIPIGKNRARVGLGIDKKANLVELFNTFLKETKMLKNTTIVKKPVAWMIPIGIPKSIAKGRAMLVGDSAMQVKPFSGGGLFTGMLGAEIAASVAIKTLKKESGKTNLDEYKKEVAEKITPIIKRGLLLRKIFKSMPDEDKALFLNNLNNPDAKKIIVSYGDIDSPYIIGAKLLKFIGTPLLRYFVDMVRGS